MSSTSCCQMNGLPPAPPKTGCFGIVIAWPAGGVADYGVLEELAAQQHVQVMIMDSKLMPPVRIRSLRSPAD